MKGIILAGGLGTRLGLLTQATSKQLLSVYDRPMICYPLETLTNAGINDILIITAPKHIDNFTYFLNDYTKSNGIYANLKYAIQNKPTGIPEAFIIGEHFIGRDNVALILGDNIFSDNFAKHVASFDGGGKIFTKKVPDPNRFGIVKFNEQHEAVLIKEKPKKFISPYAITGFYIYDRHVIEVARQLKPSDRLETEIADVHKAYLQAGQLSVSIIRGAWIDAGTPDSLLKASNLIAKRRKKEQARK